MENSSARSKGQYRPLDAFGVSEGAKATARWVKNDKRVLCKIDFVDIEELQELLAKGCASRLPIR